MATKLQDLVGTKCPLCGKVLTDEEFHKAEDSLVKLLEEQHREDLDTVKKQAITETAQKFMLQINEKEKRLQEIIQSQNERERIAKEEALRPVREELLMRDKQIQRLQQKAEQLTNQLNRTQSELKGEIGEVNLFEMLTRAFPTDHFTRPFRGVSSPDIIQQIRKSNGLLIESKIVYDNKNVLSLRQQDIEKVKQYIEQHKAGQGIIVTRSVPKSEIKNGYFGQKDGVLIIHPDMVVEIAVLIRSTLVKIHDLSINAQQRELIQEKVFAYIRSEEFTTQVSKINELQIDLVKLQDREEKAHNTLWRERKEVYQILKKIYLNISSGIDSMLGEQS